MKQVPCEFLTGLSLPNTNTVSRNDGRMMQQFTLTALFTAHR